MLCDLVCFDLCGMFIYGCDVEIDINVIIEGNVIFGYCVKIGIGCVIKNSVIGDDCEISLYIVVEDVNLVVVCIIGLFVCLCFGVELLEGVYVGNFVEMKKVCLGKGFKVGYLIYLGDVEIGDNVNIGVGIIICNYDGVNKFKIIIGDDVFVGFDIQLVVLVIVGKGVIIVVGIIVMCNVGENVLVISRVLQIQKEGWCCLVKKK